MNNTSDLEAKIHVLPFEESGRTLGNHIKISKYFPALKINGKLYDVSLAHDSKTLLKSGVISNIRIKFKVPISQIGSLTIHDTFELTEGPRTCITGSITKIYNKVLSKQWWEAYLLKSIEELDYKKHGKALVNQATSSNISDHLLKKPLCKLANDELLTLTDQITDFHHIAPLTVQNIRKNVFLKCKLYQCDLLQSIIKKLPTDWGESNFLKNEIALKVYSYFATIKRNDQVPEEVKKEMFYNLKSYLNLNDKA